MKIGQITIHGDVILQKSSGETLPPILLDDYDKLKEFYTPESLEFKQVSEHWEKPEVREAYSKREQRWKESNTFNRKENDSSDSPGLYARVTALEQIELDRLLGGLE